MTKKERKEIYLKAAELLGNIPKHEDWACCPTISMVVYKKNFYKRITNKKFPEFYLFEPEYNDGIWWKEDGEFPTTEHTADIRRTALLLAAEMCN